MVAVPDAGAVGVVLEAAGVAVAVPEVVVVPVVVVPAVAVPDVGVPVVVPAPAGGWAVTGSPSAQASGATKLNRGVRDALVSAGESLPRS